MFDLRPAVRRTAGVLTSVADDQLDLPTPCGRSSVGEVVDHLGVFAVRFRGAARKQPPEPGPPPAPDRANLEPDWRARITRDLDDLADAWQDPAAWEGSTVAGGIEMPAEVVGLVALDELLVHGWDIAVATGQRYDPPLDEIEAASSFVASFEAPRDGRLFGPVVDVGADATPWARLVALTGRDPAWTPGGVRRVVTGHDADGRSVFVSDDTVAPIRTALSATTSFHVLWNGDAAPSFPDAGGQPPFTTYFPPVGGFRFGFFTLPPHGEPGPGPDVDIAAALEEMRRRLPKMLDYMDPSDPGMHTTDTVDFEVVLSGEVTLELDDGAIVHLRPGDTVVQNGTRHRWGNPGTEPATLAVFICGAHHADVERPT